MEHETSLTATEVTSLIAEGALIHAKSVQYKGGAGVCVPVNRDLLSYCSSTYYEHLTRSSTSSCTPSMLPSVHGSKSVDWEWGNGARIVEKSRTNSSQSLQARRRICCISTEH